MAEPYALDLGKVFAERENLKASREQNRLMALMAPFKEREVQRGEQEAIAAQRDSGLKRTGAAARLALGVIGDLKDATPEDAQARYNTARQLVADMGVDVSRLPEQWSPDVQRGIESLAAQYGGAQDAKFGLNLQEAVIDGKRVVVQPMAGGAGYRVLEGVTPPERTVYDSTRGIIVNPAASSFTQPQGATPPPGSAAPSAPAPTMQQIERDRAEREASAAAQKEAAVVAARERTQAAAEREQGAVTADDAIYQLSVLRENLAKLPAPFIQKLKSGAAFFGAEDKEFERAVGQIRQASGKMLAYVERLPGAATDKDRIDFKASAGVLDDSNASPSSRLAAAESAIASFQRLQQKYGGGQQRQPSAPTQSQLPPAAASKLREGVNTTFSNGQVWTLRSGSPVRVK